jgi:hypothetical protein
VLYLRHRLGLVFISLFVIAMMVPLTGCPTTGRPPVADDGGDGGNDGMDNVPDEPVDDGGGNQSALTVVKTNIEMHTDKRILAGDDIIVFGTGGFAGVDYMVPSAGDTAGRGIPDGDTFVAGSFAVAGKKIALSANFVVTIFDTESGSSETINVNDIRLTNTPSGIHDAGHMQSDGDLVVVRSESSTIDGRFLKVIDVSGDTPNVISFTVNPGDDAPRVEHVMVDAATRTAVAVADGIFYIYDIDDPTAEPATLTVETGIGETPPHISGDYIIFQDEGDNVGLAQISTSEITFMASNPAAKQMAIGGGSFGYFVDVDSDDSLGSSQRSATGTVDGGTSATLAPVGVFIDGSTTNNGALGYGETMAITKDGRRWILAGTRSLGSGEYLQVNTGGGWSVVADPTGADRFGCPASDVSVSSNTVAFKTGNNTDVTVGYVILP